MLTFEVVFSFRSLLAECYVNIDLAYDTENSCFSFNFSCKDFHFLHVGGEVPKKYKLEETKTKVSCFGDIYERDYLMELLNFELDRIGKFQTDFYFLDNSEMKMLEEGINSMEKKLDIHRSNIVFSRDIYKFVGNKAYAKTYFIYFLPRTSDEPIDEITLDCTINEMPDLQITNFKISNKPADSNHKIDDGICTFEPILSLAAGEYFKTIEFEYSFTLENNEEGYTPIQISKHPSFEGGKYELFIKNDNPRRDIFFARHIDTTTSEEYDYIYKSFFKTFDDDIFYFNIIKVYN